MPKKTSRSARALEAQRSATTGGERKNVAQPLVDLTTSNLSLNSSSLDVTAGPLQNATTNGHGIYDAPQLDAPLKETEPKLVREAGTRTTANSTLLSRPSSGTIAPASRRPIGRRTTSPVNRQPVLTRDEEYAYIRTDLLTVFILTVVMIVALLVLTLIIGR